MEHMPWLPLWLLGVPLVLGIIEWIRMPHRSL